MSTRLIELAHQRLDCHILAIDALGQGNDRQDTALTEAESRIADLELQVAALRGLKQRDDQRFLKHLLGIDTETTCFVISSGRKFVVRPSVAESLAKSLQANASLWTRLSKH